MEKLRHGIRENWRQFTLLVIVNAFVGGMVGLERSVFPALAESDFGITSHSVVFTFIISFGISKALANYAAGRLANRFGRKKLLLAGWIQAIPVPFIIMYTDSWAWIVFANVLLGIHQGFAWSSTVLMKIDIAGSKNRGLAMGINEFAGYIAVGTVALLTAYIAAEYGARPYPYYIGVGLIFAGLVTTWLFIKDTMAFVKLESAMAGSKTSRNIFRVTTYRDPNLGSITQAGMVNNLNDGMVWGLLPLVLAGLAFSKHDIGIIAFIYPAVWGMGQLFTGPLSDKYPKRNLIAAGMALQGIAITGMAYADALAVFGWLAVLLGIGTALVYPTFLSGIAAFSHPEERAESVGVFRLWRDLGYAIGALITGLVSDAFGNRTTLLLVAFITIASGIWAGVRMKKG
jgi:MFS family permease